MSHNPNTTQAQKEQDFVKDKAHDVVEGVRKVREEGVHKPGMPTTDGAVNTLDKAENAVDRLQGSHRGTQMGGKGQEVLEDIKRVIQDEKAMVRKNDGELIQHILSNSITFLHDISSDSSTQNLFSNWQNLAGSLFNTSNATELLATGKDIFKSLKDTEEFLHLASEMINMLKLLVAEGQERLTENRAGNLAEIKFAKENQKEQLIDDLVDLLRTLAANEIWMGMTARAKNKVGQVKEHGKAAQGVANDALNRVLDAPATSQLIGDVRTFLQRLVGSEMDVNAFFNVLAQVLYDFSENQEFADVFYEMEEEMQVVAKNPLALDDPVVKKRLEELSSRAHGTIQKQLNSPNVNKLRQETQHLVDAVMNEPSNLRLLNDTRKLWHDIKSDQPGQLFDPTLLTSVRQMIIPMFLDHLSNVPVPPIHDSGELLGKYDYSLENIKLDLPEILPENIHLRFDHQMDANLMNLSATNQRTFIFLEARDIQVHLRNVAWSYNRHRLPRVHDSGNATVDTEGRGVTIRLKMEMRNDTSNNQLVEIHAAQVHIDRFRITFSDSKHNKLYKMLTTLFSGAIKRAVEDAMEKKMKDFGSTLNTQIITMLHDAKSKTSQYQGGFSEKFEHIKQTASDLKIQALDTKDRAISRVEGATDSAKASLRENTETAKSLLREHAQKATGEQDPGALVDEARQEVRTHARGAITLAAERATSLLDQQQQKIEEQRLEKQFDKHVNLGGNPNWTPVPSYPATEMSEFPTAKLSKEPVVSLSKEPIVSLYKAPPHTETKEEKEEWERHSLMEAKKKQQAGSSDVPLGFSDLGGNNTTSADLTFALHSGIPAFDAPTPKMEQDSSKDQAKQGL